VTIEKEELTTSVENKVKTKFIYLDNAGNDKLLHWLLLSLGCWLMLERRFCVYNAGVKVDASREILTVIMMSYYKNVRMCKRHIVVGRTICFWQFVLLFLGLATNYRESWLYITDWYSNTNAFQMSVINHQGLVFNPIKLKSNQALNIGTNTSVI